MKNKLVFFILICTLLLGCSVEDEGIAPLCLDGDCDAVMELAYERDENGYYHVPLDWDGEFLPRFNIDVEAEPTSPEYHYNDQAFISATFDTDSYWRLGDSLAVTLPLYDPFGLQTQNGTPIPVNDTIVYLNQFEGMFLPLVQKTQIYFNTTDGTYKSRRIVGPIPPQFINDTIKIWMKVTWEGGINIQEKEYLSKIIIE